MNTRNSAIESFESDKSILLSIKSIHAERIYSGKKKFELRKAAPKHEPRLVFLYETDISSISGWFLLKSIDTGTPEQIWNITGALATPKESFDRYYKSSGRAVAMGIEAAYRLKKPIPIATAKDVEPGFTAPQAFAYLNNYPSLLNLLYSTARSDNLENISIDGLSLSPFDSTRDTKRFITSVEKHISGSYKETGKAYAEYLINCDSDGFDAEGVFTKRKSIFAIFHRDEHAGYIVTTEKIGGSVKTGPVIITKKFRNKGLGQNLRKLIHELYRSLGHRKVYATVPANNLAACAYLIASNYRIEGHLNRHYHDGHDELVLGYPLRHRKTDVIPLQRQITPPNRFFRMRKASPDIALLIKSIFSEAYCEVTDTWVSNQVTHALRATRGGKTDLMKPRLIFGAEGTFGLVAASLCVIKRGGSAKISILTRTGHINGLVDFISHIETSLSRLKNNSVRKVYAHIPYNDTDLMNAFYIAGYTTEGIISVPYNCTTDMIIFSKAI